MSVKNNTIELDEIAQLKMEIQLKSANLHAQMKQLMLPVSCSAESTKKDLSLEQSQGKHAQIILYSNSDWNKRSSAPCSSSASARSYQNKFLTLVFID